MACACRAFARRVLGYELAVARVVDGGPPPPPPRVRVAPRARQRRRAPHHHRAAARVTQLHERAPVARARICLQTHLEQSKQREQRGGACRRVTGHCWACWAGCARRRQRSLATHPLSGEGGWEGSANWRPTPYVVGLLWQIVDPMTPPHLNFWFPIGSHVADRERATRGRRTAGVAMSVNPRSCGGPAEEGGPPDFGAGDLLGPVTFTDAALDAAMGFGQPAGMWASRPPTSLPRPRSNVQAAQQRAGR